MKSTKTVLVLVAAVTGCTCLTVLWRYLLGWPLDWGIVLMSLIQTAVGLGLGLGLAMLYVKRVKRSNR